MTIRIRPSTYRRRTIPIIEDITPDHAHTVTPHDLPDSFPVDILDDEQIEAVADWWARYTTEVIDRLRSALCALSVDQRGKSIPNLEHYLLNVVALGHLLRLHPAVDNTITELAHALGVNARTLRAAKLTVLEALATPAQTADPTQTADRPRHKRSITIGKLGSIYPALDIARAEGKMPVVIVPFRRPITLASQMTLALAISRWEGITCTLWETGTGENALKITYYDDKHTTRKKRQS